MLKRKILSLFLAAVMLVAIASGLAVQAEEALPEETAAAEEPAVNALADELISSVVVTADMRPIPGDLVGDYALEPEEGSHFTITAVKWRDYSRGTHPSVIRDMSLDEHFRPGDIYRIYLTLTPEDGYSFADAAELTASTGHLENRQVCFVMSVENDGSDSTGRNRIVEIQFHLSFFRDVINPDDFWFRPVYWAAGRSVVSGWVDGTFRPWNTCNREVTVEFLWRLFGHPRTGRVEQFPDVDYGNDPFLQSINWAVEQGITTGYSDGTFRPTVVCNRAAFVTFLWRAAGRPAVDAGQRGYYESYITDLPDNEDFANAIIWGVSNGIITGWDRADGTIEFRPWEGCNRASLVTFIYRYAQRFM